MTAAVTETLRSLVVGGEVFFTEFVRRNGASRLHKVPRPFDCILIDDKSRLARNVADALKMVEVLQYYGVRVIFISLGIDTSNETARQLLTFNGMMDEQYLAGLADKVHRGQEGRVMKGFSPGGKCQGTSMCLSKIRTGRGSTCVPQLA